MTQKDDTKRWHIKMTHQASHHYNILYFNKDEKHYRYTVRGKTLERERDRFCDKRPSSITHKDDT